MAKVAKPFQVGDHVLQSGQPCVIVNITGKSADVDVPGGAGLKKGVPLSKLAHDANAGHTQFDKARKTNNRQSTWQKVKSISTRPTWRESVASLEVGMNMELKLTKKGWRQLAQVTKVGYNNAEGCTEVMVQINSDLFRLTGATKKLAHVTQLTQAAPVMVNIEDQTAAFLDVPAKQGGVLWQPLDEDMVEERKARILQADFYYYSIWGGGSVLAGILLYFNLTNEDPSEFIRLMWLAALIGCCVLMMFMHHGVTLQIA